MTSANRARVILATVAIVIADAIGIWSWHEAGRLTGRYECLADYTQANNAVSHIRAVLANQDRTALKTLVESVLAGGGERALITFKVTTNRNDDERAKHPLPDVPECPR
jgi:hypothetical protein